MLKPPLVSSAALRRAATRSGGSRAEHALSVLQHRGIEIDELPDALGHTVGGACDRRAGERVADQDHVLEVLELQDIHDVLDEGVERDRL
jgi:hypothetical protein